VEQHDEDEHRRDREEGRRRVVHADRARHDPEQVAPDGQDEDDAAREQPQQGVALLQAARADQLEHDADQHEGGKRRDGGRAHRRHRVSRAG
jgi:hypothetical protein